MAPRPPSRRQPASRRAPSRQPARRPATGSSRPAPTRTTTPRRPESTTSPRWSRQRRLRLARTIGVVVVVALVAWQCTRDSDEPEPDDVAPTEETETATPTDVTEFTPIGYGITQRNPGVVLPAATYRGAGGLIEGVPLLVGGITHPVNTDTELPDEALRVTTDSIWRVDGLAVSAAGVLPATRRDHFAATIGDQMMIAGGEADGSITDSVSLIAADGTIADAGPLPDARTGGTAVSSPDGASAYLVGGHGGSTPDEDVLATSDGAAFFPVGTLAVPVDRPAVAIIDETLWIAGGTSDGEESTLVQTMNIVTGETAVVAELPTARSGAAGFVLADAFYVAGGRTSGDPVADIARIDPETYEVTATGALPYPIADAFVTQAPTVVRLYGGVTLAEGGDPDEGEGDAPAVTGTVLLASVLELSG